MLLTNSQIPAHTFNVLSSYFSMDDETNAPARRLAQSKRLVGT